MPMSPKKRKNGHPEGIFREIFVSASRELSPFGTTFVFPPENYEQKKLGTVFGIIKIADTSHESSYVANLLTSVIRKEYFSKPDRPADESFEAGLRKANLALAELACQGSVKWTGKINFAGGALEKNNLHYSKLGTTSMFLLRGGLIMDIAAGMGAEQEGGEPHPLKTFSDIGSGKLEKDDCLILATSDLSEIFSPEELRQNAARFSRDEFPGILSASLQANAELAGAIVLNLVPAELALPAIEKKPERYDYFSERETAEAITPAEKEVPAEKFPRAVRPSVDSNIPPRREKHLYVSETEEIVPKKTSGEKIYAYARKAALGLAAGSSLVMKKTNQRIRRINWREIFSSIKSVLIFVRQAIKKINWQERNTRIAAAVVILVILSFSFLALVGNKDENLSPQPAGQTAQDEAPVTVLNDINVKNIENISEVASLAADSRELIFTSGNLYVLSGDKSIVKIDPTNGNTEKLDADVSGGKFLLATAMPDLNTIFILTADKKIVSFTPINKRFQENNIAFPENLNAAGMKTFLTYLYIIDPQANQIYRYPRAEGGFGERQVWLKAGSDIKDSKSFAINEDIFAASSNQIAAWLQGRKDEKTNFENPTVSLAIDKIFTAPDFEGVYILDNKNRRIVRYSKEGKITAQYFDEQISGIRDLAVDEKNKTIYLLKNDNLSKFNME